MRRIAPLAAALALPLLLPAQPPHPPAAPAAPAAPTPPAARPASAEPEIKPFDRVIPKDAKTTAGLFRVHRVKSKLYYEIPVRELGKDMLWVSQLAKTTLGAGYGGTAVGNRVVRWERVDNRILLRDVSYDVVAAPREAISRAVEAANTPAVLMAFNIEALGKDNAPVIDVTRLFTTEVAEFSPRRVLRARGFDSSRSFIETAKAFPENINVTALQTFTSPPAEPGRIEIPSAAGGMRGATGTVVMAYSMVKLPEKPMQPRLFDKRLGYFTIRQRDFGVDEHKAAERRYITRWRLEKKDPAAAVSEPVKPIVYYVDPATPAKWVPYVKKGIEDWQPAFEEAGFRRAIVAKDPPSPSEDPDWSPEDARISVVRWLPSTIKNAMGPHVHDPRTGEILESDIQMYHNILELQRDWYFAQAAPLDARAQKLPLPDELMGELIRYVVAHEVGHTLGLPHNMKASSTYPVEKLRDREWLRKMGHTPTLMDYSRFNYVAQPEDNIPPQLLVPGIGPYDRFSIMWGYKPVPGARTPDDEKATLNDWLKVQETTPWLRFSASNSLGVDPGELTEAVGDADAVLATTLGTKNIQRVVKMLLTAVPKPGENYDELGAVYTSVVGQWSLELGHVVALVGGFHGQEKDGGQPGVLYEPVAREKQKAAVDFLNANLFHTPKWLVPVEVERRLAPYGALNRVARLQRSVLSNLLNPARMTRLMEQEALDGAKAYRPADFLADLRQGLFSELAKPNVAVDPWRRNLQRAYLEVVNERLNVRAAAAPSFGTPAPVNADDDTRGLLRAELRALAAQLGRAAATDRATRAHLDDMKDQIARILDPKFAPAGGSSAPRPVFPSVDGLDTCWPDLRTLQ